MLPRINAPERPRLITVPLMIYTMIPGVIVAPLKTKSVKLAVNDRVPEVRSD